MASNSDERIKEPEHIRATPLFDVFSVSIHSYHNRFNDGRQLEVYGTIHITDAQGNTVDIYNRPDDDPEIVILGGTLSLNDQYCGFVSISKSYNVEVDLHDRARGLEIAKGRILYLSLFDRITCRNVLGECGFATMSCSTIRHAVVANIELSYIKVDGCAPGVDVLHGSVVACYGANYAFNVFRPRLLRTNLSSDKEYMSRILFNKTNDQPIQVSSGTSIGLSRSDSSLVIEVDLLFRDTHMQEHRVSDKLEFQAFESGSFDKFVEAVPGKDCCVRVQVTWSNAYKHLPKPKTPALLLSSSDEESMHQQKLLPFLSYLLLQSTITGETSPRSTTLGSPVAEVFSILIYPDVEHSDVGSNVCGTIEVCGFNILGNLPVVLNNKGIIIATSMVWPSFCFNAYEFSIKLNVKDDKGNVLSKGSVAYNILNVGDWFDRRICSVFRGEHGYAAVHYTLFSNALQAQVRVKICSSMIRTGRTRVFGKVVAYYAFPKRDMPSDDCDNYQTVLFEASRMNASPLTFNSDLPLSKPMMPVPADSLLVIESRLWAIWSPPGKDPTNTSLWCDAVVEGSVKGELSGYIKELDPFEDLMPETCQRVCHLEVFVTFGKTSIFAEGIRGIARNDNILEQKMKDFAMNPFQDASRSHNT